MSTFDPTNFSGMTLETLKSFSLGHFPTLPLGPQLPTATIGRDVETDCSITIGDIERRSGLYVLGKPGMGKTSLLVNLILQDIEQGHGVFFLDPHGDAIEEVINRLPSKRKSQVILIDPTDKTHTFGINLLRCNDISDINERNTTYSRVYGVFERIWRDDFGPWLQLILSNTLNVFIENQGLTLSDVPLFFENESFRSLLVSRVRYNRASANYWQNTFATQRARDRDNKMDAALTRIHILLTREYIRHVVGQVQTTVDFGRLMQEKKVVLLNLPSHLPEDDKRFLGTILISELLYAVRKRADLPEEKRQHFCIFVDEFQNFASSEDFSTLITEARKFGIATTIAHQERYGQFADNKKMLGATAAAANKLFFQLTVNDARELAPEFAVEPPTESKHDTNFIISQEPVADLLRRGHTHPKIQEFVTFFLRPKQDKLKKLRDEIENQRLIRMSLEDEATTHRDEAALYQTDARMGTMYAKTDHSIVRGILSGAKGALESTKSAHEQAQKETDRLMTKFREYCNQQERMRYLDRFFVSLMDGRFVPRLSKSPSLSFSLMYAKVSFVCWQHFPILHLYLYLTYGDPKLARTIPSVLALMHWPEKVEETYMKNRREYFEQCAREREENFRKKNQPLNHEYYRKRLEEIMQEELASYRRRGFKSGHGFEITVIPPDLPARVLTPTEVEEIRQLCYKDILQDSQNDRDVFKKIEALVETCYLLTKPENHIKVPSGQFVERPVYTYSTQEMVNQMAQELSSLPRFTAYAKVLRVEGGEQTVVKHKIRTIKPGASVRT